MVQPSSPTRKPDRMASLFYAPSVADAGKLKPADPIGVTTVRKIVYHEVPDDPKTLKGASPLTHVRPGLPPFLVMSAGYDYPPLARMAKEFTAALEQRGCEVQAKIIPGRTHETMLFDILNFTLERAAADAIVEFIDRHPAPPARKAAGKEQ